MKAWLGVAAAYLTGTLAFWWPLPARLATHVWGDRFDAWTTLWLVWHLADRVRAGDLAAVTDRILHPIGYNLWSFGHAALQALGAALVAVGVPLVLAYNLLLLGALWTSALAAHLLGRELGGGHRAGFAAGIVFATSPYLYGEGAAGCVELVSAGFLPLFAWTLVRLARVPTWRRALAAAAALAVVGPFNWYYTLFAGMLGVGFVVWQALAGRREAAAWAVAAMALAAATNAPLIPLVRRETPTRPPISAALYQDPAAWVRARELADATLPLDALEEARLEEHDAMQVAQNQTPLLAVLRPRFTVNPLGSTPGALAYLCGLVGAVLARGRAGGWLAIAGGATVLTLGPWLMVDDTPPLADWAATLPLPYAWAYEHLPFFSKAYRPYRIGVVALTALAAAAATGLAGRGRRWDPVLVALGLVAFTQPFWAGDRPARRPLADARVPAVYTTLRDLPDGAAIELPLRYQPISVGNAKLQYAQVVHGKPLLNCNQLIRRTDLAAFRDYVRGNALLSVLAEAKGPPWRFADADVAALVRDGFRWIVLHPRVPEGGALEREPGDAELFGEPLVALLRGTFGPPAVEDPDAWIFEVPPDFVDRGRAHAFTADDVVDVDLRLDARRLGLPLALPEGGEASIWTGRARKVAFWAKGAGGTPPAVRVTGQADVVPVVEAGAWRRVEVDVTSEDPVSIAFAGPGRMEVTRVQVVTR